jgi:hypothetical protein
VAVHLKAHGVFPTMFIHGCDEPTVRAMVPRHKVAA